LARGGALPPARAARALLVFAVSSPSVQLALNLHLLHLHC
jgi:hypothetical protein